VEPGSPFNTPRPTAWSDADPAIGFRSLTRADFALVTAWIGRPHVAEWWTEPADLAGVEDEYGPCVDGTDPTRVFLILSGERPVGLIQCYRLADEPSYAAAVGVDDGAGVDLFVGEDEVRGGGFGSTALRAFVDQVVWPAYPEVARVMAGPSVRNQRSQRAFEKAGFVRTHVAVVVGERDPEQVMVLDRPR
jgi:aminoglycoside 6'-N-acetyltransferase